MATSQGCCEGSLRGCLDVLSMAAAWSELTAQCEGSIWASSRLGVGTDSSGSPKLLSPDRVQGHRLGCSLTLLCLCPFLA